MNDIASIILIIFILLLFAKIVGGIFEKLKMPKLIGEILAGVIFINLAIFVPGFGDAIGFSVSDFNDPTNINFFEIMGELGIIFLLFSVGLEMKFSDLMKVGRTAINIAVLGIVIPFAGGMLFVFHDMVSFEAALLIGAALFGTSTAVGVECLRNVNAMDSMEAKLIISATIIDDILCLALLGIIIGMIQPDASMQSIIINAVIVVAFVLFMFLFISRIKDLATRRKKRISERKKAIALSNGEDVCGCETEQPMEELGALGLAILVCMGLAAVSVNIGLAAIIGAFFAGMIFAEFKDTVPCEQNFNAITYFMLPFFFLWVGMEVQFDRVLEYGTDVLILLIAVLIVAVVTKYVAGFLGSKTGKLANDSSHLVGVSFIPRGEVGIIVATLGLRYNVFGPPIFTVIILMALITSMVAPPFITRAYLKIEKNRAESEIPPVMPDEDGSV